MQMARTGERLPSPLNASMLSSPSLCSATAMTTRNAPRFMRQ
jgi:hypothetical protein